MVTVRFYGITRLVLKQSSIQLEVGSIEELLLELGRRFSELKAEELKNCVILVNGTNMVNLQLYKTKLNSGDEVQLFSPVAGG